MFTSQTLFEFAVIAGTIFGAMTLVAWSIHRKQCPPELRWPKPRRQWLQRTTGRR
ncbi:hypothetical protein PXH66_20225 [Synoicihabitans lomoniglobus]|uniref:Uncharacterized protein n=1 Tax=Synoicihabitans lomoniglobus TaxID=2909285 RepID=A0AAE9ZV52_9BACT|nr:hypothetical protein PXH66_20225 [Opitutaceae bacterium LMO-M01]